MPDSLDIFNNLKVSGNLPSMPQVLVQLIDSCHGSEIELKAVAHIINKDAAISAKLLQLVNSSFIGCRKALTNVEQAVVHQHFHTAGLPPGGDQWPAVHR